MPSADISIVPSASGQPKSVARLVAVIGRCSTTSTPAVYAFDTPGTVTDEVGYGPGPDLAMAISRESGQRVLLIPCATSVAGSLSAVTETPSGSGPDITVAGTVALTPWDTLQCAIKVVKAGAVATAKVRISLDDGLTYGPTITTAATYAIPRTGITVTFPAGTYVLDTVYTFSTTAPTPAAADVDAAIAVAVAGTQKPSIIVLAQTDTTTVSETVAMINQLETTASTALATSKVPIRCFVSAHPDATDSGLETAIVALDADRVCLFAGDAYISSGYASATMRRPACWAGAIKAAKNRFSSDLGNGNDGPLSYVQDYTRNEFTATTKLRDARCCVLETRPGSTGVFFSRGVTLGDPAIVYTDLNLCRVVDEAYRICQPLLNQEVNNDPVLKANGTISDDDAERVEAKLGDALEQGLLKPSDGVPHASAVEALVDRANVMATSEDLAVTISVQKKAQQKSVTGTIGISPTSSASA
jgi:hypothetical protein